MAPSKSSKPLDNYATAQDGCCIGFFDTISALCGQQPPRLTGTSLEVEGTSPSDQPHNSTITILPRSSSISSSPSRSMRSVKGLGLVGSHSLPSNEHDHQASAAAAAAAAAGTSLEVEGCGDDELDDVDEFVVPSHFYDDLAEYYRNTTTAASLFFSKKKNVVFVIAAVVFAFSCGIAWPLSNARSNEVYRNRVIETSPTSSKPNYTPEARPAKIGRCVPKSSKGSKKSSSEGSKKSTEAKSSKSSTEAKSSEGTRKSTKANKGSLKASPSRYPSASPSRSPSASPSRSPSASPSRSRDPSASPSRSRSPSSSPSRYPSSSPSTSSQPSSSHAPTICVTKKSKSNKSSASNSASNTASNPNAYS